jgi:broad specificity phosphatase PhoE
MMHHELKEKAAEIEELKKVSEEMKLQRFAAVRAGKGEQREGKVVHWVRHGQGQHNIWAANWEKEGKDGDPYLKSNGCMIDPPLTEKGQADAKRANEELKTKLEGREVIIVSSPMQRTLQTMQIACEELNVGRIVGNENVRERYGLHICDNMGVFDRTQFALSNWNDICAASEDVATETERETYSNMLQRGVNFVKYLQQREEKEFVVFSQSSFLLGFFNGVLQIDDADARPFYTGEVRSVTFTDL